MKSLLLAGFILILAGIIIVIIGSLIYTPQTNVSVGGFILIGPLPFLFGAGQYGPVLSIISLVLGIIMVILIYAYVRKATRTKGT